MSDIAIRVENCILSADLWSGAEGLSKLYHLGRAQQRHDTLRDAISDFRLQIGDLTRPNRKSQIANPKTSGRSRTSPSR